MTRSFTLSILDDTDTVVGNTQTVTFQEQQDGIGIEMQPSSTTITEIPASTTITKIRFAYQGTTLHDESITNFTYEFEGDYIITAFSVNISGLDDGADYAITRGLLNEPATQPQGLDAVTMNFELLNGSNVQISTTQSGIMSPQADGIGIELGGDIRFEGIDAGDVASKIQLLDDATVPNEVQLATLAESKTYTYDGSSYTLQGYNINLQ